MDVNLSEEQIRDGHNPGSGGWPTIRYFNKKTGIEGGTYVKKTDKSMCEELGDEEIMGDYVNEYGNTSLCSLMSREGCDDREIVYIEKMILKSNDDNVSQLNRLVNMEGSSMKPELLVWLKKRKAILKQIVAQIGNDEL
mmetsp:Transcript_36005/g.42999  ORF Transcript_36005/g.42999 Transcript_36005/m.42999 type:complete len:139 (+) Transcript_36005:319-735(+)